MLGNQGPFSQIENDETGEAVYSSDRNENTEPIRNSAIPRIMIDDEIFESTNPLNSKQRDVFNVVHNWAKEYADHKGVNVKPVHIFLYGHGSTGKSHLVKTIYNAVLKTLLLNYKKKQKHPESFYWDQPL